MSNQISPGYKKTEIGIIPEDWDVKRLKDIVEDNGFVRGPFGGSLKKEFFTKKGYKVYTQQNAIYRSVDLGNYYIDEKKFQELKRFEIKENDFIVSCSGTIGKIFKIPKRHKKGIINQALLIIRINTRVIDENFFYQYFTWEKFQEAIIDKTQGGAMHNLVGINEFKKTNIIYPPLPEQRAITRILSDFDALIEALDRLIEKKKNIKKGATQELLTGKKRLPGFTGEWERKRLEEVADCLDEHRVPLNEEERGKMRGTIPYCGANGILDYVNDYTIYDDIILLAEDGGHFEEFKEKPIAYRMIGKCWVNNHAHIIKAKDGYSQDFLFYSLVHKDIREYIGGGTRAKLNKGEMMKIEISLPPTLEEQRAIAQILSDIDAEIEALERKKKKYEMMKKAAMEVLLTGKIRVKEENGEVRRLEL